MSSNIRPDITLAARLFDALREKTFDGVGVTREAYGPGEEIAHALVRAEAEALGLEITVDFAGNMYMTLPGSDRALPRIILGSHLDSVPQGGNFDGAAGVLCGMAVVGNRVFRVYGYARLQRRVPIFVQAPGDPRVDPAQFNAALVWKGHADALTPDFRATTCSADGSQCVYERPGGCSAATSRAEINRYLADRGM